MSPVSISLNKAAGPRLFSDRLLFWRDWDMERTFPVPSLRDPMRNAEEETFWEQAHESLSFLEHNDFGDRYYFLCPEKDIMQNYIL
jgi:hypothetical protein